jgi:hypothetical protein
MMNLERGKIANTIINMAVINQNHEKSPPSVVQVQFSEINQTTNQSTRLLTKPNKLVPWTIHFNRWGFTAHFMKTFIDVLLVLLHHMRLCLQGPEKPGTSSRQCD